MAKSLLQSLMEFVEGNKSVRMVSEDIELTCELVLLVRMMFADGELLSQEMQNFTRLCETAFGIPEEDVPQVLQYLKDFGYETSASQAAVIFTDLPVERKRSLLVHMLSIAKADDELHEHEVELIRNTANILGLTAEDIRKAREG
ncbi:MAG: TerB family tellurite resistance protein [Nitratireductor sp.]|nr:TerB family tellurite resistance protein [Nitratireductor sp.]MCB1458523.1 TerB family tellurite resistance protein [Nitratireductor sp.]